MSAFVEIAREAFRFLEDEYGFIVTESSDGNADGHVTYVNTAIGVGIRPTYEFSSAFVFVFVYRLVNGECHNNALPITGDTEITCIDFNDALSEDNKMRPAYDYDENSGFFDEEVGLRNYVTEFSNRLRRYGVPLLEGDFSVFVQVAEIIKRRAQELNQK